MTMYLVNLETGVVMQKVMANARIIDAEKNGKGELCIIFSDKTVSFYAHAKSYFEVIDMRKPVCELSLDFQMYAVFGSDAGDFWAGGQNKIRVIFQRRFGKFVPAVEKTQKLFKNDKDHWKNQSGDFYFTKNEQLAFQAKSD